MTAHGVINLTIDIETWGGPTKPSLEDIKAPANYKDEAKIKAYREEKMKTAWKDQGLDSLKGEVCCLGYQYGGKEPVSIIGTEEDIITKFANELSKDGVIAHTQIYWIGHNLTTFDLPWILHRAWKYRLSYLVHAIPTNPYDEHIVDIMRLFAGPGVRDPKHMRKLDIIAKFLGLEGKTEGFDGSMVHDAFVRGEIDRIADYCENDCEQTTEVAKILKPEIW